MATGLENMKDIFLMLNDLNAPKTKKPINQNQKPNGFWLLAVGCNQKL